MTMWNIRYFESRNDKFTLRYVHQWFWDTLKVCKELVELDYNPVLIDSRTMLNFVVFIKVPHNQLLQYNNPES